MNRASVPLFVAALLAIGLLCCGAMAADHADVIDLGIRHQTIENFGASDAWTTRYLASWSDANRNRVADLLFSVDRGIGLSLWRFNIGGGTNTRSIRNPQRSVETFEVSQGKYDWTHQAGEQWFARAARNHGVPFLLGFVNSPPGRMTRTGLTNSDEDYTSTTNLKPGFEQQYATYLCDILQHFHKEPDAARRLDFDFISPVNEPQIAWNRDKQEGSRASNDDIKTMLLALHEELSARNLSTHIRAPESNAVPDLWRLNGGVSRQYHAQYGDYLHEFLGDPIFANLLDNTLCYHDYSSASGRSLENDHRKLGEVMTEHPQAKVWMSEICIMQRRRDLGMGMALDMAKLIHADLALSGASAWHWWLAVSNADYKDGLIYTDWQKPGDAETIIVSKALWTLGNYSRFIRPGMIRVELKGDHHGFDGVLGSAYVDPQAHKLVMVYTNVSEEPQRVSWSFSGAAAPALFTPYVTSADADLMVGPPVSSGHGTQIAPRSIVTYVGTYQ